MAERSTNIVYGACSHSSGFYHFCGIHGQGDAMVVYPIGLCRINNKKGGVPCQHVKESEAIICFRDWQRNLSDDEAKKEELVPEDVLEKLLQKALEDEKSQ